MSCWQWDFFIVLPYFISSLFESFIRNRSLIPSSRCDPAYSHLFFTTACGASVPWRISADCISIMVRNTSVLTVSKRQDPLRCTTWCIAPGCTSVAEPALFSFVMLVSIVLFFLCSGGQCSGEGDLSYSADACCGRNLLRDHPSWQGARTISLLKILSAPGMIQRGDHQGAGWEHGRGSYCICRSSIRLEEIFTGYLRLRSGRELDERWGFRRAGGLRWPIGNVTNRAAAPYRQRESRKLHWMRDFTGSRVRYGPQRSAGARRTAVAPEAEEKYLNWIRQRGAYSPSSWLVNRVSWGWL